MATRNTFKLKWQGTSSHSEAALNCGITLLAYAAQNTHQGKSTFSYWYRINDEGRGIGPFSSLSEAKEEAECHITTLLEEDLRLLGD